MYRIWIFYFTFICTTHLTDHQNDEICENCETIATSYNLEIWINMVLKILRLVLTAVATNFAVCLTSPRTPRRLIYNVLCYKLQYTGCAAEIGDTLYADA